MTEAAGGNLKHTVQYCLLTFSQMQKSGVDYITKEVDYSIMEMPNLNQTARTFLSFHFPVSQDTTRGACTQLN